jgi:transcriptional regulator with XRE-family HTH domain
VTRPKGAEDDEHEGLGRFLRRCRTRIAGERTSLGNYLRLPSRVGKTVSQEEVAEAVGISRQWYATLESDRAVSPSAAVLGRIADALMMGPTERSTLFRLALPDLRLGSPTSTSRAILDAFGSLRRLMRRLWAATSEGEALTLIREQALTQLPADAIVTRRRAGEGLWDHAATGDHDADERAVQCITLISQRWGPATVDDAHCYTLFGRPGEVVTRSERDARRPILAARIHDAMDFLEWANATWAMSSVQTKHGFVARLMAIHNACHEFSESERAMLGALADLTSVALSA